MKTSVKKALKSPWLSLRLEIPGGVPLGCEHCPAGERVLSADSELSARLQEMKSLNWYKPGGHFRQQNFNNCQGFSNWKAKKRAGIIPWGTVFWEMYIWESAWERWRENSSFHKTIGIIQFFFKKNLKSSYRNEFETLFSVPWSFYWIHAIKSQRNRKDNGLHLEKYLGM